MTSTLPEWVAHGQGQPPRCRWSFAMDGPLVALALGRESGELAAADATGGVYLLDRAGQVTAVSRGLKPIRDLAWSDTGRGGMALLGDDRLCRLDEKLQVVWDVTLPEPCVGLAVDPQGNHVAVGLADGRNALFDRFRRRIASFESVRPLRYLQFLLLEPALVAAAEYGLLARYRFDGHPQWTEKLWSNVGALSLTANERRILLAGFTHGIQVHDELGQAIGSYLVEGTACAVAASFVPKRLLVGTLERRLYWLDSDGAVLWTSELPDDIAAVCCDPLGGWAAVGLASGRILRLDWSLKET